MYTYDLSLSHTHTHTHTKTHTHTCTDRQRERERERGIHPKDEDRKANNLDSDHQMIRLLGEGEIKEIQSQGIKKTQIQSSSSEV